MTKLQELANQFLKELQAVEQNAKTEGEFDELETICEDVLCGIPISILQKDYYKRSDIRTYLNYEDCTTENITKAMKRLYDLDTISFCYDSVNDAIMEDLDYVETEEGEQNG